MDWAEVINNPLLKNLPFKIELNKWGQILISKGEIEEKVNLYLAQKAKEVWVCREDGEIKYFSQSGPMDKSRELDLIP